MYYAEVMVALKDLENKEKAKILSSFFKTGKGEYGYGDVFLGVQMPKQRKVAKKFSGLPLKEIKRLLKTTVHEHRMTALLILILQYKRADESRKKELFEFYLENTKGINNWDLVDVSASDIVGNYLLDREKSIIYELAKSNNLWERRIAIISTFEFIKNNRFDDTLKISEILLNDTHDLIHKAVGWMLREVGKKDQGAEERFLDKHYNVMPRTMLRYAIERFSDEKRMHYLGRDTRKKKEDKAISISTTKSKLDRKLIHDFLKDSYWAKNITLEQVEQSIKNSFCIGIYEGKKQVGFARVITDYATFAYLADVFILEVYRGKGFSMQMLDFISNHHKLQNIRRWLLATKDAHGLYEKYGFKEHEKPYYIMMK